MNEEDLNQHLIGADLNVDHDSKPRPKKKKKKVKRALNSSQNFDLDE